MKLYVHKSTLDSTDCFSSSTFEQKPVTAKMTIYRVLFPSCRVRKTRKQRDYQRTRLKTERGKYPAWLCATHHQDAIPKCTSSSSFPSYFLFQQGGSERSQEKERETFIQWEQTASCHQPSFFKGELKRRRKLARMYFWPSASFGCSINIL